MQTLTAPAGTSQPRQAAVRHPVGKCNEPNRVEWIERTLARLPAGARLLDAGAGEQQFRKFCGHLDYVSQDFAQYDGEGDGTGLQTKAWDNAHLDIVSDITAIPEPDASFDAVLCTEVLEHVPDPLAAIRELARLTRPGGRLIVTAPFCSLTHFAPYHYATGFSRYFYRTNLPSVGFEVLEIEENGNYFEYLAQETRRLRGVAERYAGATLTGPEQDAIDAVIQLLARLSDADTGSSDLLHFGCQVLARRI